MKRFKVIFLSIALCLLWSANIYAESQWEIIAGDKMHLVSYGFIKNGSQQNKMYPSVRNNNAGEYLLLNASSNTLYWNNSADGNRTYRYSIKGDYLYLYTIKNGKVNYNNYMWIKLEYCEPLKDGQGKLYWEIYTTDSNSTYRYFNLRFK
ncbi:MAG: hypothetical protein J6B30_09180 [Muribaculaceae bacterium]|nr:hypothetical protein [Muribaculaceae bacterium]